MGRQKRRLREYIEEVDGDDDLKEPLKVMRRRLGDAEAAEHISTANKKKNLIIPEGLFEDVCKQLSESGVTFPSTAKQSCAQRRAKKLAADLPAVETDKLIAALATVEHWSPDAFEDGADQSVFNLEVVDFDPLQASVATCDGSAACKALRFAVLMLRFILRPFMAAPPQRAELVVKQLTFIADRFSQLPDDIDDEYLTTTAATLVCVRCLLCFCNETSPFEYWEDFMEVVAPQHPRPAKEITSQLCALLKADDSLRTQVAALKDQYHGTKKHIHAAKQLHSELKSSSALSNDALIKAVGSTVGFVANMRKGSVHDLVVLVSSIIDEKTAMVYTADKASETDAGHEPRRGFWDDMLSLFEGLAASGCEDITTTWRPALQICRKRIPEVRAASAKAEFITDLEGLTQDCFNDMTKLTSLQDASTKLELFAKSGFDPNAKKLLGGLSQNAIAQMSAHIASVKELSIEKATILASLASCWIQLTEPSERDRTFRDHFHRYI